MVIYGEYLFIENFVMGFILLFLTGKLCGIDVRTRSYILGSVICGLYSFVIFFDSWHFLYSFVGKLLFSFVLVALIFRLNTIKKAIKTTAIFFIASFILAGVTVAMMSLFASPGIIDNGVTYVHDLTYLKVLSGGVAGFTAVVILISFLKKKRLADELETKIVLNMDDRNVSLNAIIDTGNFLKDPITGYPVIIVEISAISDMFSDRIVSILNENVDETVKFQKLSETYISNRIKLIPFKSVGSEEGLILGIRPDSVIVVRKEDIVTITKIVIGLYKGSFCSDDHYSALLNPSIFEGSVIHNG